MLQNTKNADLVTGFKFSFADVIASGVDPQFGSVIQLGAGMTVSQSGGNLAITTGTTAYSETTIRSRETFDIEGIFRYGLTLSQRIVDNNFVVELVDVIGDYIPIVITSAVSVTVKLRNHGFSSRDIGKGIWIGNVNVAASPTQRATIASITDADNFVLTVAGFPASGNGYCSLFGMNHHQVIYSGTTTTSLGTGYTTQRKGWRNTPANATIASTTTGHIGVIESCRTTEATYSDASFGSSTSQQFFTRATMNQNVPEGCALYLQIRAFNNATPPASTTTMTLAFVDYQAFNPVPINITASEAMSLKNSLPVTISNTLTVQGTAAHSAASSGFPVRAGGRVNTAADITLTAGDVSDLFMSSAGQLITKPFGSAESDWYYVAASGGILNTTTAATIKSAAGASVRNYITQLQIMSEALGAATELAIRDGAAGPVLWRTKIATAGQLTTTTIEFPTPIKGSANTLLEVVTLTASVTGAVYVNAQGFTAF